MLTHDYTYTAVLAGSVKNAWTVDDCYQGRDFDFERAFLPDRIVGTGSIECLDDDEKLVLNHIRANSYCHIFAFVEEFIVPMVLENASRDVFGDETRLRSLLRFAEEEVKHQEMLDRASDQMEAGFAGFVWVLPGREAVAEVVLGKSPLAALLLTSMIEWFTQAHYVEHVLRRPGAGWLVPRTPEVPLDRRARCDARLDSLLIEDIVPGLTDEERETAVDELLELGERFDASCSPDRSTWTSRRLAQSTGRAFSAEEHEEIRDADSGSTAGRSWCRGSSIPSSCASSAS